MKTGNDIRINLIAENKKLNKLAWERRTEIA